MNPTRSIVGKLWLGTVALVVVTLLVLGLFLNHFLEEFYYGQKETEMVRHGARIAQSLSQGDEEALRNLALLERYLDSTVMVVNRDGLVRACGGMMGMQPGMRLQNEELEQVLDGKVVTARGFHRRFNMAVLSAAVPIEQQGSIVGAVMLYTPVAPVSETIGTMRRILLWAGVVAVLLVTVLGFFMTRRLSLPLLQMKENARRMADGDFAGRVTVGSDDEIGMLGKSLNYMAAQLEKSMLALSQEKEKLANIVSSMSDGVMTFDAAGAQMFANERARELLSPPGGEERNVHSRFGQWVAEALAKGCSLQEELTVEGRTLAVRMSPLWDGDNPAGAVALLQDVTKERALEQLRREFLASVSHELRTPLTYLQGYAEAMQDGLADSPEQREQVLSVFMDETLRLRRLVNDLMDIAQLENGQLNMDMDKVDLTDLVAKVKEKMLPLARAKEVDIDISLPDTGVNVWGDADRLQQVLVNLVDNAVQHTPAGGRILVAVSAEKRGVIRVKDSGPGIDRKELELIWERFYKVDKARTRNTSGTGLGLAIVKNIVEAHGGSVSVESEVGKGAEFTVCLPLSGAADCAVE